LRHTPAGAFGSARYKLKKYRGQPAQYERLIEVFKAHDIGYFFYNGGGDSADTCFKVSMLAEKMGYPLQAIHVPKTVDNDLPITDCCPGFGSVAKYVAVSIREAGFDVASMARTSTKVFVLEVMGRHAAGLRPPAALQRGGHGDAPHIILFPEIAFDERSSSPARREVRRNTATARRRLRGRSSNSGRQVPRRCRHFAMHSVTPSSAAWAGDRELVKDKLGYKYHWAVADYLQRAARHIASKVDVEQAYAVGKAAVDSRSRDTMR
jgi:ATP-dependent phosphofructokinase / diphosphate-dependent phosphofructokinase